LWIMGMDDRDSAADGGTARVKLLAIMPTVNKPRLPTPYIFFSSLS